MYRSPVRLEGFDLQSRKLGNGQEALKDGLLFRHNADYSQHEIIGEVSSQAVAG
jgi:hypothetical protein